jgi:hypothetical protein
MMQVLRSRSSIAAALLWVQLAAAPSALACPACFAASSGRVSRMYLLSGLLLSFLPLAIVGGIAWWWWRRHGSAGARS